MKRKLPKPTEGELAILRVLWRQGPGTVRAVHTALGEAQETGYTTVLKMMQIMAATLTQKEAQRRFVGDLLDRVFDGSAHNLVLQALSTKKASATELASIRKLLEEMERGAK